MKLFLVILTFCFSVSLGAQSKTPVPSIPIAQPWGVVKVGSLYRDEGKSQKDVMEIGTGSLVQLTPHRAAVLTAAHVIRGSAPWIEVNGIRQSVKPENILFDADHDVAIVEIVDAAGARPVFLLDSDGHQLSPDPALTFDAVESSSYRLTDTANVARIYEIFYYSPGGFLKKPIRAESLWILDASWAPQLPPRKTERGDYGVRDETPTYVNFGDQIRSLYRARPGLSGTSTIKIVDAVTSFGGILVQYNSFFRDAYFASPKVVNSLVRAFVQGRRGANSKTDWFMRNGLTFRRYSEGFEEALFINRPSGNGIYVDPGNGIYVDPGTQGIGSAVPEQIMDKYGLSPGMLINGKQVIGIRAVPLSKDRSSFILYANPQAIVFMRKHRESYVFSPILVGEDLIDGLKDLIHMWHPKLRNQNRFELAGIEVFAINRYRYNDGSLVASEDSVTIKVSSRQFFRKEFLKTGTRKNGFTFTLDRKGCLPGQNRFSPIVDATDTNTGERFRIDLRGLFFIDLTNLETGSIFASPTELKSEIETIEKKHGISLPVRSTTNRFEIEQQFWDR